MIRSGYVSAAVVVLQAMGAMGCETEEGPASCEELVAGDLAASDGDPCSGSWSCYLDRICAPSSSYFCEMGRLRVEVGEPIYVPGCPDGGYVIDGEVLDAEAGVSDGAPAEGGTVHADARR